MVKLRRIVDHPERPDVAFEEGMPGWQHVPSYDQVAENDAATLDGDRFAGATVHPESEVSQIIADLQRGPSARLDDESGSELEGLALSG